MYADMGGKLVYPVFLEKIKLKIKRNMNKKIKITFRCGPICVSLQSHKSEGVHKHSLKQHKCTFVSKSSGYQHLEKPLTPFMHRYRHLFHSRRP